MPTHPRHLTSAAWGAVGVLVSMGPAAGALDLFCWPTPPLSITAGFDLGLVSFQPRKKILPAAIQRAVHQRQRIATKSQSIGGASRSSRTTAHGLETRVTMAAPNGHALHTPAGHRLGDIRQRASATRYRLAAESRVFRT